MSDERTSSPWPSIELMFGHQLTREQLLDLFGKTSSEWTGEHGVKRRVMCQWLGNPAVSTEDNVEAMDLDIQWISFGGTTSVRNDELSYVGQLHRSNGRTLVGDGKLCLSGRGFFTIRVDFDSTNRVSRARFARV